MAELAELLDRWNSGDGKPYKGSLIDFAAYEADPANIGCMCAQGQVLHLLGNWSPTELRNTKQSDADRATAELLNISVAHSILLRSINDKQDGPPSIVLTNPERVLGDQAHIVLAFWLHLDRMTAEDWAVAGAAARAVAGAVAGAVARAAARAVAGADARAVAGDTAWDTAWDTARAAAWDTARAAARAAAWDTARAAEYACSEIQGARIMREKGQAFHFLPMFGFADPEAIPALPADYGRTA
jgi:hypothetical protein